MELLKPSLADTPTRNERLERTPLDTGRVLWRKERYAA
tara:strand:+ start:125 stop:238 length:114 start_codon:yes stop_codon:yes gene_type:complete